MNYDQGTHPQYVSESGVVSLYWDLAEHIWRIVSVDSRLNRNGNGRDESSVGGLSCRDFREALRMAKAKALIEGVDLHIYSHDQRLEETRSFMELADEVSQRSATSGFRPWLDISHGVA